MVWQALGKIVVRRVVSKVAGKVVNKATSRGGDSGELEHLKQPSNMKMDNGFYGHYSVPNTKQDSSKWNKL